MSLAENLAHDLAAKVIAHVERTGDEDIIAGALGDWSQTLQEALVTSVRVVGPRFARRSC